MASYFANIKKSFKFKNYINYLIVIVALVLFVVLQSTGLLKRSSANLLAQIGYSIILAVSLNLVVGFLGELSLGHAGFMCVGAYLGGFVANKLAASISSQLLVLIISMVIGGVAAAIFGFLVGLPALKLKGDYLAIVTLAFGEIVRNLCKNLPWFGEAKGLNTTRYGEKLFIIVFVVLLIMLILTQNLIKSKHGRAITAIRDSEIASKAMGLNVTYYKLLVFVISAFFAGIAGAIYSAYATPVLYSNFSYNYSIEILVMVVLGGMGNITGSILSATLITYVNFILTTKLSGDFAAFKYLIYALVLIVVVVYNNAPGLAPLKAKITKALSIKEFIWRRKAAKNPEKYAAEVREEKVEWARVPTKVNMDEVLSTDVTFVESSIRADGDKPTAK